MKNLEDLTEHDINTMKDEELEQVQVDIVHLPFGTRARHLERQREMFAEEEMGEQVNSNVFLEENRRMEELTKKRVAHALDFFSEIEELDLSEYDKQTQDTIIAERVRLRLAIISKL